MAALAVLVLGSNLNAADGDGNGDSLSLFPVALEHSFGQPARTFDEVRSLILKNYYTEELSEEALYWAAIEGMLRYISPPETPRLGKIWTAEAYEQVRQSLNGVQVSIGVKSTFNPRDGSLTVTRVLPGGPAESILQPYDRILRIDDEPLKGTSVDEVNALFKGEEGSDVTLTINRDVKVFEITLERREVELPPIGVTHLGDSTALIVLKRFTKGLSADLDETVTELGENGVDDLILDVRNNGGGVFIEALRTAELFLPAKTVLLKTVQKQDRVKNYISANESPHEFDMVVLANEKTGSSAELFCCALRDNGRALLVGSKTYGKGVFEKTFALANDCRVKFITGAMFSPRGRSWQGEGVLPDFFVEQTPKAVAALRALSASDQLRKDLALTTAYKLLKR